MDYDKLSKVELIGLVKAAYEHKDKILANNYFEKITAKHDFIDRIRNEILKIPTHKNGMIKDDFSYDKYGESDGVESEHIFKKRTLSLIKKIQWNIDDSHHLSKETKLNILNSIHTEIEKIEMCNQNDLFFERWSTGFKKYYILPVIDKVRDEYIIELNAKDELKSIDKEAPSLSTCVLAKRRKPF